MLIVPVVSQSARNMLAPVTIIAFATFFVDQPYPPALSGNGVALGPLHRPDRRQWLRRRLFGGRRQIAAPSDQLNCDSN